MYDCEGVDSMVTKMPLQTFGVLWIIGAYQNIIEEMSCNAWRKKGLNGLHNNA
jgi:hypothetical protein